MKNLREESLRRREKDLPWQLFMKKPSSDFLMTRIHSKLLCHPNLNATRDMWEPNLDQQEITSIVPISLLMWPFNFLWIASNTKMSNHWRMSVYNITFHIKFNLLISITIPGSYASSLLMTFVSLTIALWSVE